MSNKSAISDIKPVKSPIKLFYCSKCGQKQNKVNQKYCSNCGSPFYIEQKISDENNILDSEHQGENYTSNLNRIGGWLILPYIGFYLFLLYSVIYIAYYFGNYSVSPNKFLLASAIAIFGMSFSCIIQIHKRNKLFRNYVYTLYSIGIIQSLYISFSTHKASTFIIYGGIYFIWMLYFSKSKRVEAFLGSKE